MKVHKRYLAILLCLAITAVTVMQNFVIMKAYSTITAEQADLLLAGEPIELE